MDITRVCKRKSHNEFQIQMNRFTVQKFGNSWDVQFSAGTKEPFSDGSTNPIQMVDMVHSRKGMTLSTVSEIKAFSLELRLFQQQT